MEHKHHEPKAKSKKEFTEDEVKSFKQNIKAALVSFGHVDMVVKDGEVTLTNSLKKGDDKEEVKLPLDADISEFSKAAEKLAPEDVEATKQRQALASGKGLPDPVADTE